MDIGTEFPAASDTDSGDVILALQTASALWKQGDSAESLRWLRRAAEAAESGGDDLRALALARSAAELREKTGVVSIPPPPAKTESAKPVRPPSLPAPPPRVVLPAVAKAPEAPDLSDLPTPPPSVRPPRSATPTPPQAASPKPAAAPAAPRPTPSPSTPPPPRTQSSVPPARPAEPPRASAADTRGTRTALRVSVELLSAQSGTLMVRVLGDGESAPAGAHEALLVPVAPGVDLRRATTRSGHPPPSAARPNGAGD